MAFKMRNNPMQRNFGIGGPMRKDPTGKKDKDTRTDQQKTDDWNAAHSEEAGTTATYNPDTDTYVSDKTQSEINADHYANFKKNVLKNSPNMTEKEIKEAYANRRKS